MSGIVYECVECEYRVRDDEGTTPASIACPQCCGLMKRIPIP